MLNKSCYFSTVNIIIIIREISMHDILDTNLFKKLKLDVDVGAQSSIEFTLNSKFS